MLTRAAELAGIRGVCSVGPITGTLPAFLLLPELNETVSGFHIGNKRNPVALLHRASAATRGNVER